MRAARVFAECSAWRLLTVILNIGYIQAVCILIGTEENRHERKFRSPNGAHPRTGTEPIRPSGNAQLPFLRFANTTRRAPMNAAEFNSARKFAQTQNARVAYIERGEGPEAALLLHGFPLCGY